MTDKTRYLQLGEIYREHGVSGFCKFYSYSGSCDHLIKGESYLLKPLKDAERSVSLLEIYPFKRYFLIHFDLFAQPEDVVPYRKATLWIEKSRLKRKKNEVFDFEYEGCRVYDTQNRNLGLVTEIIYTPLKQLLIVPDSSICGEKGQELTIPFVVEWIRRFDLDKKEIVMELPEGLC